MTNSLDDAVVFNLERRAAGSMLRIDLPAGGCAFRVRSGRWSAGRCAILERMQKRPELLRTILATSFEAAGLGALSESAAEAFHFEAAARLRVPQQSLLWCSSGRPQALVAVGEALAALETGEVGEGRQSIESLEMRERMMLFATPEGEAAFQGVFLPGAGAAATTLILGFDLAASRPVLEALLDEAALHFCAGRLPEGFAGDVVVLAAMGRSSAPPLSRLDDARIESIEAALRILVEGFMREHAEALGRTLRLRVTGAETSAEALRMLEALAANRSLLPADPGGWVYRSLECTEIPGLERTRVSARCRAGVFFSQGLLVAGSSPEERDELTIDLGRGARSVEGTL